jgi:parvulin-like peptidyl-prolyl isomerase
MGLGVAALLGGCGKKSGARCQPAADHSVVGCYGSEPITTSELAPFLPAAVRAADTSLSSPRIAALDEAIGVRLLADEATRRQLPVAGESPDHRRAAAYQALRRDLAAAAKLTAADVADAGARAYYERHPGRFNKITETHCRAIFVADDARAADLMRTLAGATEEAFADAARKESKHPSAAAGGDLGETHAEGTDERIRTLSNDLRDVGQMIGPARLDDGTYVILYAARLEMVTKPYDEVAAQVRNRIAHDRQEAALAELIATLRPKARIQVFASELEQLPLPAAAPLEE